MDLSKKMKEILLTGSKSAGGSFEKGLRLFAKEFGEQSESNLSMRIYNFCVWLDAEIGGATEETIENLWHAFENPENKYLMKFAQHVRESFQSNRVKVWREEGSHSLPPARGSGIS